MAEDQKPSTLTHAVTDILNYLLDKVEELEHRYLDKDQVDDVPDDSGPGNSGVDIPESDVPDSPK